MAATNPTSAAGVEMPKPQVREHPAAGASGLPVALMCLLLIAAAVAMFVIGMPEQPLLWIGGIVVLLAALALGAGLTIIAPNEARVIQFLGHYTGTVRTDGLRWVNPLTTRHRISTRIRNHETSVMKVNDIDGNPIEIASVVVWQVRDTARALFEVDNFVKFVSIQTETAVRHIATNYPYDAHTDGQLSLRENADEITERLSREIAERVESAGVKIIESRFTHLAYASEIAQAMLRRQQAGAIVAARARIVEGAVGMVDLALQRLSEQEVVELDEERKAAMVSNLMVVLCADHATQPVINTGSLYQ